MSCCHLKWPGSPAVRRVALTSRLLIWGIAGLAIAGVVFRPLKVPEAVWALGSAVALVCFGLLPVSAALDGVGKGVDVYLFLVGMLLLAELAGNTALAKTMRVLSTLTCLIISLYSASTATSCRSDEHSEIVAAIARKDSVRATTIMLHHLDYILGSLHLEQSSEDVDLESIFLSGIAG